MTIIFDKNKGFICNKCGNNKCIESKGIYTCPVCNDELDHFKEMNNNLKGEIINDKINEALREKLFPNKD
ncbi:hypothetical protein [Fluviispira vulneris]|uniref:hypothetical protein n=1 Tax=Fluviispira vulneris TaxID=2763012 RepID=UPI0016490141|nr:hypothetical protein [Fluviispira vulneris]